MNHPFKEVKPKQVSTLILWLIDVTGAEVAGYYIISDHQLECSLTGDLVNE